MSRQLRHPARVVLLAATLLAASSCGRLHRGDETVPDAVLIFVNESLDQADVFIVVPGSETRRIGTVMGGRTDTLVVPRDIATRASTVDVAARLLARSMVPRSGPISISPGDWYQVRLPIDEKTLVVLPANP